MTVIDNIFTNAIYRKRFAKIIVDDISGYMLPLRKIQWTHKQCKKNVGYVGIIYSMSCYINTKSVITLYFILLIKF